MGVLGLWAQASKPPKRHPLVMRLSAEAALALTLGALPAAGAVTGPVPVTAPDLATAADPKAALLAEMDEVRLLWLPVKTPPDPITTRFAPRLGDLRRAAETAAPGAPFETARRDYHDWKVALYYAKFSASGANAGDFAHFANELARQESFTARSRREVMFQAAQNRVLVQQLIWRSKGTGDGRGFFDLSSTDGGLVIPKGFVVGAAVPEAVAAPLKPVSPEDAAAPPGPTPVTTSAGMFTRFIQNVSAIGHRASETISNAIFDYAAGVQKFLTAGLIQAESGFQTVGSWAGCFGIAQFSEEAARLYHVIRGDSRSSVKGAVAYQRDLQAHFAKPGDDAKLQHLFVEAAAHYDAAMAAAGPNPSAAVRQRILDESYSRIAGRIPYGIENAIAAYNAGQGAVDGARGWTHLPLPRGGCVNRPAQDDSYCQTMAYVPRVLKNSFNVYLNTREHPPSVHLASN